MVLSGVPRIKSPVTSPGIDPGTIRLVTQRLNHYATPGLILHYTDIRNENKTKFEILAEKLIEITDLNTFL
jgi:hypothetical protein